MKFIFLILNSYFNCSNNTGKVDGFKNKIKADISYIKEEVNIRVQCLILELEEMNLKFEKYLDNLSLSLCKY